MLPKSPCLEASGSRRAGSEEVRALQRSSAALQMEMPITTGARPHEPAGNWGMAAKERRMRATLLNGLSVANASSHSSGLNRRRCAVRRLPAWPAAGARRSTRGRKARRWPPPSPTPPPELHAPSRRPTRLHSILCLKPVRLSLEQVAPRCPSVDGFLGGSSSVHRDGPSLARQSHTAVSVGTVYHPLDSIF